MCHRCRKRVYNAKDAMIGIGMNHAGSIRGGFLEAL